MADTNVRRRVLSGGRCQFPRCPRDDIATNEQASSILRPTTRIAQWPRRHRPNTSADDGNCSRRAARACAGKSRSTRAPHGVAAAPRPLNNQHNAVTVSASWAVCCNFKRDLPGSHPWNRALPIIVPHFEKYQRFASRCNKRSLDDSASHVYPS